MSATRDLSARARLAALAILFVAAAASQATYTVDVVALLSGAYPMKPIALGVPWPTVIWADPSPTLDGIQKGDRVAAVDGHPPRGAVELAEAVRSRTPGSRITITTERDGLREDHQVLIRSDPRRLPMAYAIGAELLMPVFCLALGFWVAAVRPHDFRAWLILGMLLGMSQLTRSGLADPLGWGAAIGLPSAILRAVNAPLWAVSMMFFGIYFPRRWSIDRKLPWLKWLLLIGPTCLVAVLVAETVADALSFPLRARLPLNLLTDNVAFLVMCPCISVFFASISQKYGEAMDADDRRRLRLLYWGASVSLTPMLVLFLVDLIARHRAPGDADGAWLVGSLAAMMIFPLTLAYVVVVEHAMDVRMVIREGVQYALASKGVRVLQGLMIVAVVAIASTMAGSTGASRAQKLTYVAIGVTVALRVREGGERLRGWVDRRFFREAYDADRILSELSEQVRGILDRDALLETVARKISQSLHVERVAVLLRDGGVFRPALATGYEGPLELAARADDPAIERLRTSRAATPGEGLAGLGAQLLLPLAGRKELLGFIGLGSKRSEEPYSQTDRTLLETVAAQTGLALENAQLSEAIAHEVAQRELLNREIEIAREVQQRLFPQNLPEIAALEYAGYCRPARGVGGDYYDFLALASGRLGLAIGDVSGKGVPAALLMASLQASVRGQSQGGPSQIAELMTNVNRLVCDASAANRYATFFYAQFDPATRRLTYSNGGHNNPVVLRGAEVLRLEIGGPPVGLFPMSRYEQAETALEPGDVLIFFTDGVSEAENAAQDEFGEEALIESVRSCREAAPMRMIEEVMEAADRFAGGAPQHDDMTLVIARVG
jgi:phosphoserine phosphatase RsbU/P